MGVSSNSDAQSQQFAGIEPHPAALMIADRHCYDASPPAAQNTAISIYSKPENS
jgi:hypothetical protein